ncbi:MAG: metallophosphoesterase [Lactobacillus sp.]|nr:metallophosphoesterase [Lactobacillus sp.]
MKLFNFTKSLTKKFKREHPTTVAVSDQLQQYVTIGEYEPDAKVGSIDCSQYILTVYQDEAGLHQALRKKDGDMLSPDFVRTYNEELGYFRPFRHANTGRRVRVESMLDDFVTGVKAQTRQGKNSINIGLITDTHFKDRNSADFYGWNGLTHVREFSYLDQLDVLNFKAHLGDWIDGSDAGLVSENELVKIRCAFVNKRIPFMILKGDHDENDKFDENHDLSASFPENEFANIMWPSMYKQMAVHYISKQHGVCYFDFDDIRLISVNTSDVPYSLNEKGQKIYDAKLTMAVREDQIEEIIEILTDSDGKKIVFLGHSAPIDKRGNTALKYNGRSLHELFVAFNQRESGRMHSSNEVPAVFRLSNRFDFSAIKDAKIVAFLGGHQHMEDQYRINGIQYILFNCSALMGQNHSLTTKYNKAINRKLDRDNESCGYIVNVDLQSSQIQAFGFGAGSRRRVFLLDRN